MTKHRHAHVAVNNRQIGQIIEAGNETCTATLITPRDLLTLIDLPSDTLGGGVRIPWSFLHLPLKVLYSLFTAQLDVIGFFVLNSFNQLLFLV